MPDPHAAAVAGSDRGSSSTAGPSGDRRRFHFQHNWFDMILADWERLTRPIRDGRKLRVLEIGSFEGGSTTWILENLLDHPESSMVAVDSFQGGMEHQADGQDARAERDAAEDRQDPRPGNGAAPDGVDYELQSLEQRFLDNVKQCRNYGKLRVVKAMSQDALVALAAERSCFDFIYIDGSHVAIDVLHDAVLSWRMLSVGGTLVFDDYMWKGYHEHMYNPRMAIEAFVKCVENEADPHETLSQLWVTKVPSKIKPTSNPDGSLYYWDMPRWSMVPQDTKTLKQPKASPHSLATLRSGDKWRGGDRESVEKAG